MSVYAFWLVFLGGFLTGQLFAYDSRALYAELESECEGDILRVTNTLGQVVAEIDFFEDEEFQVIKPIESEKCYLLELCKKKKCDEEQCYQGVLIHEDEEPAIVREECENRQAYQLVKSTDCTDEAQSDDLRRKRVAQGCIEEIVPVNVCVENESYCVARYGWWRGRRCKEWATRCKRYEIRYRTVKTCT